MSEIHHNTNTAEAVQNAPKAQIYGHPDEWVLICKYTDSATGNMNSTKAMVCAGGVVLLVSEMQGGQHRAPALCFIPGAKLDKDGEFYRII